MRVKRVIPEERTKMPERVIKRERTIMRERVICGERAKPSERNTRKERTIWPDWHARWRAKRIMSQKNIKRMQIAFALSKI